jgi:hypothetical protein
VIKTEIKTGHLTNTGKPNTTMDTWLLDYEIIIQFFSIKGNSDCVT